MISYVENNRLVHLTGDPSHPYTKGKLCAKGYSYIERNYHRDRLKYPYFQEVKGSGKFKQITWEKAYNLIISEMMHIHQKHGDFLPLAFYKGTGNVGVHHYVIEEFFSHLGGTTRILNSASFGKKLAASHGMGAANPSSIQRSPMIIIWGANPAATNIHLTPYFIQARIKGAKIVVIDPLYTQTAELADLYIQIKPGSDGALANLLVKELVESNVIDFQFIQDHSTNFDEFIGKIKEIDKKESLFTCGISEEAFNLLFNWLKNAEAVSYIIGHGMQRHCNGWQNIRGIEALATIHGDIEKMDGGIFFWKDDYQLFNNQQLYNSEQMNLNNRTIGFMENRGGGHSDPNQPPIEMMWISCGNPLNQEPNSRLFKKYLENIPLVVTIDQFFTPTAYMSNLILPTTTHFEELDIIPNSWHGVLALNNKAVSPYYQSQSEWKIMSEITNRLNKLDPELCSFPLHTSEEDYLHAQFNDKVRNLYHIVSISDLEGKVVTPHQSWSNEKFESKTGKFQFNPSETKQYGYPSTPFFSDGKSPTDDYPFWLITPHNPYMFNSQFHYLDLADEGEAYAAIHPKAAQERSIFNGEVVKVFNEQDSILIKAVYSSKVPKDILMIYQGWYPDSKVYVNQLVTSARMEGNKMAANTSLFDTFVNVRKLS